MEVCCNTYTATDKKRYFFVNVAREEKEKEKIIFSCDHFFSFFFFLLQREKEEEEKKKSDLLFVVCCYLRMHADEFVHFQFDLVAIVEFHRRHAGNVRACHTHGERQRDRHAQSHRFSFFKRFFLKRFFRLFGFSLLFKGERRTRAARRSDRPAAIQL
jgi:hypothetical protein